MAHGDTSGQDDLVAGGFSAWLVEMQSAIRGERASEVACGECTACCTSSQFVHIGPDETDTLAHIPAELLFPAPRMPRGHVLLGYDERGHCPMLVEGRCSIYQHRPQTCRTYDCRVFPAAGVGIDGGDKASIGRQAARWRFDYPTRADRDRHDAVRAAARYLAGHDSAWPGGGGPANPTQLAVVAVEIHELFLGAAVSPDASAADPDPAVVRAEIARRMRSG